MLWVLGAAVAVVTFFYYCLVRPLSAYLHYRKLLNVFPGRRHGHWLTGDMTYFTPDAGDIFRVLREYNSEFPATTYRMWATGWGAIVINTAEDAEVVLSNIRYIKKSLFYNHIEHWLNTGLLTSTGAKWAQRRKLLTPAFHFSVLKRLSENFVEHNEHLVRLLQVEAAIHDKIDIVPIISKHALNIICATSMGVTLKDDIQSNNYRKSISEIANLFNIRGTNQLLFFDFLFWFHPLFQVQKKLLKVLHNFTESIIRQRQADFDENEAEDTEDVYMKKKLAMLDLLLTAKKKRDAIDDKGIREEVDTFTFEGHDTVSMALSFALMLLANNKHHQERIVEELNGIFGGSDRTITFQDLQSMPYLELCLKECLRLYPSVPDISRVAEENIPLDENRVIPIGTVIHISIYDIHHNENYFPEPEVFNPDRFLPENSKNRHPFAFIPFSAGPRNCIGQKYAMMEMKSIVATILRYFDLEPIDTPKSVILCQQMVLRSKNGVFVKFVKRPK